MATTIMTTSSLSIGAIPSLPPLLPWVVLLDPKIPPPAAPIKRSYGRNIRYTTSGNSQFLILVLVLLYQLYYSSELQVLRIKTSVIVALLSVSSRSDREDVHSSSTITISASFFTAYIPMQFGISTTILSLHYFPLHTKQTHTSL